MPSWGQRKDQAVLSVGRYLYNNTEYAYHPVGSSPNRDSIGARDKGKASILSVIGGTVAIFSNEESKRTGALVPGVVSLGTSLLILFLYLGFHPF